MNITLSQAIKRLSFTISNQNKPNNEDVLALNSIIDFVNLSSEKTIQENKLFAKMFCFVLKEFLIHYKDIDFASKQINKDILSMPLNYHLTILLEQLKTNELSMYFNSLNLKPTWKVGQTLKEIEQNINDNKEIFKTTNPNEFLEVLDTWDMESVISNFNLNFNIALNTYKNV
jgi:hypothetical protein